MWYDNMDNKTSKSSLKRVMAYHDKQKLLNRVRRDVWATTDEHDQIKSMLKKIRGLT